MLEELFNLGFADALVPVLDEGFDAELQGERDDASDGGRHDHLARETA